MVKKTKLTPLAAAVGVTLAASLATLPLASAADNPFSMKDIGSGYKVAKDGSCGEGKCGGKKGKKDGKCGDKKGKKDGKCGEGKCGDKKGMKDGKCGDKKGKKDGKCGEGKCGDKK